ESAAACAQRTRSDRRRGRAAATRERRARRPRELDAVHRRGRASVRDAWRDVQLAARRLWRISRASARLTHLPPPPSHRRRVLLTGASGYIASQLLPVFRERYELRAIDVRATNARGESIR